MFLLTETADKAIKGCIIHVLFMHMHLKALFNPSNLQVLGLTDLGFDDIQYRIEVRADNSLQFAKPGFRVQNLVNSCLSDVLYVEVWLHTLRVMCVAGYIY